MDRKFMEELQRIAGEENVRQLEPMSRHTTFRVGGPADMMVSPKGEALPQVIRLCAQYEVPYYIMGNGSNLLVGDGGIRGVVIEMGKGQDALCIEENRIVAGAGTLLSKTANFAAEHGLSGMEFAAGIPGTLGGAVVMNAGAYGGEMKDIIECVTVLDANGRKFTLTAEKLELGYRRSCIMERGYIVTQVVLRLTPGDKATILNYMKELREQRTTKQPLEYPSAGSTFKRPEGHFAGKLIQDAGLRGYRVGGAQVSEKHCGFVINLGEATAADICKVICDVQAEVEKQFQVRLEPEVKMVGEF